MGMARLDSVQTLKKGAQSYPLPTSKTMCKTLGASFILFLLSLTGHTLPPKLGFPFFTPLSSCHPAQGSPLLTPLEEILPHLHQQHYLCL